VLAQNGLLCDFIVDLPQDLGLRRVAACFIRMVSRKRGRDEQDVDEGPTPAPKLLQQIRNAWEFASLMQYIFFFGKAVKIDEDLDVDVSVYVTLGTLRSGYRAWQCLSDLTDYVLPVDTRDRMHQSQPL